MLAQMTIRGRHAFGLTMVELLVVLGIVAVLAALAAPSVSELIARKRLESATTELVSDVRMARSATTQAASNVYVLFSGTENSRCYTIYTAGSGSCDCTLGPGHACTTTVEGFIPPHEVKTVLLPQSTGVTFSPSTESFYFSRVTTMVVGSAFSVDLAASGTSVALRVNVNAAGVASICTVAGQTAYPACT